MGHLPSSGTDHAIVFHLLIEIYGSIKLLGPCFVYWTYVFERMIGSLSRQIHSRVRPEANLVAIHRRDIALSSLSSHPKLFEGLDPQIAQRYRASSPYEAKECLPWELPDLGRHQPSLALTESQCLKIHEKLASCLADPPTLENVKQKKIKAIARGVWVQGKER